MSWAYLALQVTAGVSAGYTVALVYKALRAEIQTLKRKDKDRVDLRAFIQRHQEEVKE